MQKKVIVYTIIILMMSLAITTLDNSEAFEVDGKNEKYFEINESFNPIFKNFDPALRGKKKIVKASFNP